MEERIRFITHQGHKILFVDFSQCKAQEILQLLPEIQDLITSQPRNSVLALGDFSGTEVRREVADRIKETLVFDRPHIRRSALVGVDKVPKVFLDSFRTFSQRDLPVFKTREEAMDWLVKE
jgi:hypothetical protein